MVERLLLTNDIGFKINLNERYIIFRYFGYEFIFVFFWMWNIVQIQILLFFCLNLALRIYVYEYIKKKITARLNDYIAMQ